MPRNSKELPPEKVACHEAAHAVLHFFQHLPVRRISIQPNRQAGTLSHVEVRRPKWFVAPETPSDEDR